ncbi:MAG: type I pantothenate kinase [Rhizobiales bacterium]|nr:type I pantothenate kinase [Hyphomicrobiales bacterium]
MSRRRGSSRRPDKMPSRVALDFSPYSRFTRGEWARLRADTPMTLDEADVEMLAGLNVQLSMDEVIDIYLPISRLINLYVRASQDLHSVTSLFLGKTNGDAGNVRRNNHKMPFIVGLAGSVAVGKSTTARVLQALLSRWPDHPRVDLVTTDGFLLPNAELARLGLMERKGFPESFDGGRLINFVADVKAGRPNVLAPVYSHFDYDIIAGEHIIVDRPDILIVEGLNVLQPATLPRAGDAVPFVSDFFDFSIYIDADEALIGRWYIERFLRLRETAFRDPAAYFHRYAHLNDEEAYETAKGIWERINLKNLVENIRPTRMRADLILRKGEGHRVETVMLRKL